MLALPMPNLATKSLFLAPFSGSYSSTIGQDITQFLFSSKVYTVLSRLDFLTSILTLKRCCIRIMAKEFSASQQLTPRAETVEEICQLFEKCKKFSYTWLHGNPGRYIILTLGRLLVSTSICLDTRPQQEKIQYLEWFSSNGYTLVIRNYALWDVKSSVRLIDCCIKV